MFVLIERSDRLRSNTDIDSHLFYPACRIRLHTGLTKEPRLRRDKLAKPYVILINVPFAVIDVKKKFTLIAINYSLIKINGPFADINVKIICEIPPRRSRDSLANRVWRRSRHAR